MTATENCYFALADVEPEIVGLRVLAQIRPGDPLRAGTLLTVDMLGPVPVALVRDDNGQQWSVEGKRMWAQVVD